ncbi:MAG: protein of unknown function with transrane region [Parcubacteria group bacterium]|nr:protein of unknown function with transrane region [Parcubacteria group bacterium]
MSNFRLILTAIFAIFIVIGIIMFSVFRGGSSGGAEEQITVWGTLPESTFAKYIEAINSNKDIKVFVNYIEKESDSFDSEFIEALAKGSGPDAILLPQDLILRHKDKIYPIPYNSISERNFKDIFVEEGELYLSSNGIIALPLVIDPLVMYWNRDIFTDTLLSQPPAYWDEFFLLVSQITRVDNSLNIKRSAVSFGEYANVLNAKEILSLLILQAGNSIVKIDKDRPVSVFSEKSGFAIPPSEAALRFYTEFSNPSKKSYSWNRSLPISRSYFLSGDLAVYFGFASEFNDIRMKNPNLNFDVAVIPQRREARTRTTFARIQGLATVKSSKKLSSAFNTISSLVSKDNISIWSKTSGLPPVRRDLLAAGASDPVRSIFYASAIISKGWLDPDRKETNAIFQNMVESIVSGKSRLGEAVSRADSEIQNLLSEK